MKNFYLLIRNLRKKPNNNPVDRSVLSKTRNYCSSTRAVSINTIQLSPYSETRLTL